MVNLDTHVLLYAWAGQATARERKVLATEPWSISAIVLWEVAKLVQLGRVELDLDADDVKRAFATVHVWPLDRDVAIASTRLDFRSDPADELIAATSVVHSVPLLTRDRRILVSKQVPFAGAPRPQG